MSMTTSSALIYLKNKNYTPITAISDSGTIFEALLISIYPK